MFISVVLNPLNVINENTENNYQKMKYLLHHLMDLKIVSRTFCCNFLTWLIPLAQIEKKKLSRFNSTNDRFDKLYFHTLTDVHPELNKLIKVFFTLSHGQVMLMNLLNM